MSIIRDELNLDVINKIAGKRIALMGRLEHIEEMYCALAEQNILPTVIWDNDVNKHGDVFCKLSIVPPRGKARADIDIIVIYSPRHWESMSAQLMTLGYEDESEIVVLNRPSLEKNTSRVLNGIKIYEELQLRYGGNAWVFLANCPLGDYYLLGLYLHQFCDLNEIDNFILTGTSKGINKLSNLFDIQNTHVLTESESEALISAWRFLGTEIIKVKPLTIWQGDFRFNPCMVRQMKGMTFMDTFKHMIFNLGEAVQPSFPRIIPDRAYTKNLFQRLNLQQGKTVLLITHSYSIHSLSHEFWQMLIDALNANGYSVAVNVGEEREENLYDGAQTICEDFGHIHDIMEYAGYTIGIRCGFFDITSQAKCRKAILYYNAEAQNVRWNRTDMEFCSLKNMQLDDNASELLIQAADTETIKEILGAL